MNFGVGSPLGRLNVVVVCIVASLSGGACGGGEGKAKAPEVPALEEEPEGDEAEQPEPEATEAEGPQSVPTECAGSAGECLPPGKWVRRLCDGVYAEVALFMFQSGSPWQRMYLRGKTEAVNASGGASVAGFLEFDEEVLILRHRGADKNGIQIGDGSGQYDALRWNGSCVSLEGGELTTRTPPKTKQAHIEWKWLGQEMREALRRDETVTQVYRERRKECKGVSMGAVTKKCEKLHGKLVGAIADYVRQSSDLPQPAERP